MLARSRLIATALAVFIMLPIAASAARSSHRHGGRAAPAAATPIYLNPMYSPQERAADLVSRMTLSEKASQMVSSQAPAIPRLGIKAYGWWNEALHGVSRLQYNPSGNATVLNNTTSYPIDLSLGSSWDPSLMYREASAISDEAREVTPENSLNLDFYSPTVNLGRDPRWGRNDETFSEDPLLTADIASQFVDGMEGKDSHGHLLPQGGGYLKAITTIKHFAANNSEVNRRTGSSDMDERTLREYYTSQFRQIIEQSHPGSIMSSYNSINGTPSPVSVHLTDTLARQTFGFDGYFTSDCDAIFEVQAGHHWVPPGWTRSVNQYERHAFANAAGEDLDCNAGYHDQYSYANTVPTAVGQGIHTLTDVYNENDVDTALVRLFTARIKLGEFDNVSTEPWVRAARARVPAGTWTNSDANNAATETPARLDLARRVGDRTLVLLKNASGTRKDGGTGSVLPLRVPRSGPFKVAVIGTLANPPAGSMYLGGYSSTQGAPGVDNEVTPYAGIKRAVQAVNPNATVDFLPGFTAGGSTAASLTTIDQSAVDATAGYDDVIVYAGTDQTSATEDHDRSTMALPGAQAELISDVAAKNPNTVAVMETIGQVDVGSFQSSVPVMIWSSYNGQRKGDALADVLLGRYNPSGHLPFTWYQSASQLPPITDYAIRPSSGNPGRTYMYFGGPKSYPFGYGLSYTTFRTSHLRVDPRRAVANGSLHVSFDVTNTGTRAGEDLAELYATTPDAPSALQRPHKRLEGFRQVGLAPGQTRRVRMTLAVRDLAFFDQQHNRYAVDDGRYGIQIAGSAADTDVQAQRFITVRGHLLPVPHVVTAKPVVAGDAAHGVQSRVMFPAGATVDPQLTVSMSDESLIGYVNAGNSRPLPAGMRVSFTSDRPRVADVRRRIIRTVGSGVATITARVGYHGVTRSTQFVVDVGP